MRTTSARTKKTESRLNQRPRRRVRELPFVERVVCSFCTDLQPSKTVAFKLMTWKLLKSRTLELKRKECVWRTERVEGARRWACWRQRRSEDSASAREHGLRLSSERARTEQEVTHLLFPFRSWCRRFVRDKWRRRQAQGRVAPEIHLDFMSAGR